MRFTCISAANIEPARDSSASVRACRIVRDLLLEARPEAQVEVVALIDYDLKPCRMCGQCQPALRCPRDAAFNRVFEGLAASDGVFFVIPHYAPLPSKLMILFEKIQEMAYLSYCVDPHSHFPLAGKPVGIIGHGGQEPSDEVMAYYQRMLVEPAAVALGGVAMRVIGAGEDRQMGVTFGIRSLTPRPGSMFVDIQHDWDDVRERIAPLVRRVSAVVPPVEKP